MAKTNRPAECRHCGLPFADDTAGTVMGAYDEIDLPEVKPVITRHRRLKCRCATCGKSTPAPSPRLPLPQRKVTNGYRAKWAADAEAALRSTVDTAKITGKLTFQTILGAINA